MDEERPNQSRFGRREPLLSGPLGFDPVLDEDAVNDMAAFLEDVADRHLGSAHWSRLVPTPPEVEAVVKAGEGLDPPLTGDDARTLMATAKHSLARQSRKLPTVDERRRAIGACQEAISALEAINPPMNLPGWETSNSDIKQARLWLGLVVEEMQALQKRAGRGQGPKPSTLAANTFAQFLRPMLVERGMLTPGAGAHWRPSVQAIVEAVGLSAHLRAIERALTASSKIDFSHVNETKSRTFPAWTGELSRYLRHRFDRLRRG